MKIRKKFLLLGFVVFLIAIGCYMYNRSLWDHKGWQAVFLTNNQVYFGKIQKMQGQTVVLENIYYLQAGESLQDKDIASTVNLVKLGSELHGPTDKMFINRDNIIFWENLKPDSKVVKIIDSLKNN